MDADPQYARAWLTARSGSRAGSRYPVTKTRVRGGRSSDNDIVVEGPEASTVSLHHFEISRDGDGFVIRDLDSTNGTFVDGAAVTHAPLHAPATIRLGAHGPEFSFAIDDVEPAELDRTVMVPREAVEETPGRAPAGLGTTFSGLLSDAVERARQARRKGIGNETLVIMREALDHALRRTRKKSRRVIVALTAGLIAVSAFAAWKIRDMHLEKNAIDRRIQETEAKLKAANADEADRLIAQLDTYEGEAQQLRQRLLFRLSNPKEDFVTGEIRTLMGEFGAEVYSVPPEFTERIQYYLERFKGPDRPLIELALNSGARQLAVVRAILLEEQLPPDLAYIPLIESALESGQSSSAGASGPWQFTPQTARAYGLRVDGTADERQELRKATRAACKYLRSLILDFGSGSSVMLALAAYNSGPSKVKQAVSRSVRDPIKQRSFWYLYRVRALPEETRQYVPKVVAVMIIGRNPKRFGFDLPAGAP